MPEPTTTKILGNGVRPPAALGVKHPKWRLGALVSLPYSIGKVILVKTPDRSLSLKPIAPQATAGKTFACLAVRLTAAKVLKQITGKAI